MMELQDVTKVYDQGRRKVEALRGVSMTVEAGEEADQPRRIKYKKLQQ